MNIAIVVPTNRPDRLESFLVSWMPLFSKHHCRCYVVRDDYIPVVVEEVVGSISLGHEHPRSISRLISCNSAAVRNLGFYYAVKYGAEIIITLDDDVSPVGDPIEDHVNALSMRVPITWFNPCDNFMRGFPYGVRSEARVAVSHGIWTGDLDIDAVTEISGNVKPERFPYKGPIPKGCQTPVSGMNFAFTRDVAPYVYFAPTGPSQPFSRIDDIWMGMNLKNKLDDLGFAMVHGCATVRHDRASNKFDNLVAESAAIREHERLNTGGEFDWRYWSMYEKRREAWENEMRKVMSRV